MLKIINEQLKVDLNGDILEEWTPIETFNPGCKYIDVTEVKVYDYQNICNEGKIRCIEESIKTNQKYILLFENHSKYEEFYNLSKKRRKELLILENMAASEYKDFIEDNILPVFRNFKTEAVFKVNKVNYLENEIFLCNNEVDREKIKSYIYEVSINPLVEMYENNSKFLFEPNVRVGLNNTKLKESLKEEIVNTIYMISKQDKNVELEKKLVDQYLYLQNSTRKSLFNLKHNGITLACDSNITRDNNLLRINAINDSHLSIVNGAQTITNLYRIKKELLDELDGSNGIIKTAYEMIKVNLNVITTPEEDVLNQISFGLNNQIKVTEYDKFGGQIKECNTILKKEHSQINIIKTGERSTIYNIKLVDFIKCYLVVKQKPGKSKNFNMNQIESEINEFIKNANQEIINKMEDALTISNDSEIRKSLSIDDSTFYLYSRNYATSLCIEYPERFANLKDASDFIKKMWNVFSSERSGTNFQSEFKKDDFYEYILEKIVDEQSKISSANVEVSNKIVNEINNQIKEERGKVKNINNILLKKYITIENLRTITAKNERITEAFPLGEFNDIVKDLVEFDNETSSYAVKSLESNMKDEILKKFEIRIKDKIKNINLFVFDFRDDKLVAIKKIDIYKKIPEERITSIIKNVIENVEDETTSFIKESDNLFFHIRTKARNKEDVIPYSNGDYITKRAIWINKGEIQKMYNDTFNRSENEK